MNKSICLVLNANIPFIRETGTQFAFQETILFESIEDTFLPLIELCEKLDNDHIHFRFALVVPPVLCELLTDSFLIKRYLHYIDNRIEFGALETERLKNDAAACALAGFYRDKAIEKRKRFCSLHNKNILTSLLDFARRGRIEFLGTTATNIFLPFYSAFPAITNAQIETARRSEKRFFRSASEGFWLPELGYSRELDAFIRKHNFAWTIIDTHAALLSTPVPEFGSFYPAKTEDGTILFIRDFFAADEIMNITGSHRQASAFRSYFDDSGFELPANSVIPFLSANGVRAATGYKYRTVGEDGFGKELYNIQRGKKAARKKAGEFLHNRIMALNSAADIMNMPPISVCAFSIEFFGRFWYEGMDFLDELFRSAAKIKDISFQTPSEYLENIDIIPLQCVRPEFSSRGYNGYGESYLDSSNDWIYRHILRASERMTELAQRFRYAAQGGTARGDALRERTLNQAAREILLSQTSDWSRIISAGEHHLTREWSNYAKNRLETHLRNFTTFYEALGSNHVSTRLLTELELKNNIFPEMNYRVFCS